MPPMVSTNVRPLRNINGGEGGIGRYPLPAMSVPAESDFLNANGGAQSSWMLQKATTAPSAEQSSAAAGRECKPRRLAGDATDQDGDERPLLLL
jgi:hypothetical protein